jgi:hypothetical protein
MSGVERIKSLKSAVELRISHAPIRFWLDFCLSHLGEGTQGIFKTPDPNSDTFSSSYADEKTMLGITEMRDIISTKDTKHVLDKEFTWAKAGLGYKIKN